MQRVSASSIASIFENFPKAPRKKSKPGDFLLNVVFPRGHVREHIALHYMSRCQGIARVRGQNGYARTVEYLEADMMRLYMEGRWLIQRHRSQFESIFMGLLRKEVLNEAATKIAFKEGSMLFLEEERLGEACLQEIAKILSGAVDISSETSFKDNVVTPGVQTMLSMCFGPVGDGEFGYMIRDIPYTLPRYRADYGGVEVVCQPDGFCMAHGRASVIEIKSPMYGHYTAMGTPTKSAGDRRKLWVKYLVQIAIEMDVTGAEQALFVCWFDSQAKLIELTREQMQPLLESIKALVSAMGRTPEEGEETLTLENAYVRLSGEDRIPKTVKDLKASLGVKHGTKAELVDMFKARHPDIFQNNVVDAVNRCLVTLVSQLTEYGSKDAWSDMSDHYAPHGLDVLAGVAAEAAFRTYVQRQ